MSTDIDAKLKEAEQGALRLKRIDAMLDSLMAEKQELEKKKYYLEGELKKEQLDVDKLENSGILGLFYTVLGKYGERLEKEKAEALAAKLKYDQAVRDFEAVEENIKKLRLERMEYKDCPQLYESLYAKKAKIVKESAGRAAEEIMKLESKIRYDENRLKEIKEALEAGRSALAYLDIASERMNSASNYGFWDMVGGGLLVDLAKHSKIDEAKEAVDAAQKRLLKFRTELADVDISRDIRFETEGFSKFADFFFDGLIADWSMQSKIKNSLSSINTAALRVQDVLRRLESVQGETVSRITAANAEIERLILESKISE